MAGLAYRSQGRVRADTGRAEAVAVGRTELDERPVQRIAATEKPWRLIEKDGDKVCAPLGNRSAKIGTDEQGRDPEARGELWRDVRSLAKADELYDLDVAQGGCALDQCLDQPVRRASHASERDPIPGRDTAQCLGGADGRMRPPPICAEPAATVASPRET